MLRLPESLFAHLDSGGRLLVPSRQRAAAVRLAYAWQQQAMGQEVWRTPAAESVSAWIARQWVSRAARGAEPLPRTLNRLEEWVLWQSAAQRLLSAAPSDSFGLSADALADRLQLSAAAVGEYAIERAALGADPSLEARWLAQAMDEVEGEARARQALASHQRVSSLKACETSTDPEPMRLIGTEGMARGLRELLPPDVQPARHSPTIRKLLQQARVARCLDPEAETRAAAQWCCERLQRDPQARLLIVVPDLLVKRALFERIFTEQLAPQGSTVFGFEGGRPLSDYAEPREALQLLALLVRASDERDLADWLEMEFWGPRGRAARARAATLLRKQYDRRSAPAEVASRLQSLGEQLGAEDTAILAESAARFAAAYTALTDETQNAGIELRMVRALRELGWAEATQVDSHRQQIRERWQELLDTFASIALEQNLGHQPRRAVDLWSALVRRDWFAPAAEDAAVTITGSLEHPVVCYDGIWVCSLQADCWPRPRQLDPLIPWYLQREAQMPGATADSRMNEALRAMQGWAESTSELALSHACADGDERWLPSALLADLPSEEPSPTFSLASRLRRAQPFALDTVADIRGPSFSAHEFIPGGVSALVDQHACPFRAFVGRRLRGREAEEAEPGIVATERGQLLHAILKRFWDVIGSRQGLLALDQALREQALRQAVKSVLDDGVAGLSISARRRRLLDREFERAYRVLAQVLDAEEQREDFEVLASEHVVVGRLAGAKIRAQIDRIDRLRYRDEAERDMTALAIIDYKSGKYEPKYFEGEELTAVQLWAYALLLESAELEVGRLAESSPVEALANLHLTDHPRRYAAAAARQALLPRAAVCVSWSATRAAAQQQIEGLIKDFCTGDARVAPRPGACDHCDLASVCRRAELGLNLDPTLDIEPALEEEDHE